MLRRVGWPHDVVVLDFETYFDTEYTLSKMSTIEYIMDKRFEELGLARALMSGDAPYADPAGNCVFERDPTRFLEWLVMQYGRNLEGCTIGVQNGRFDVSILAFRYGIVPPHVVDTKQMSYNLHPHEKADLGSLCTRYGLPPKMENVFKFSTRRRRFVLEKKKRQGKLPRQLPRMTPAQEQALGEYARNDVLREWELLVRMLPQISRPEVELPLMQHTSEMFWNPVIRVDSTLGVELRTAMLAEVDKALATAGHDQDTISGNHSFEALLREALAETGETVPMKRGKDGMIPALAKTDKAREALVKHPNPKVRALVEARIAIKAWPSKAKRVQNIMLQAEANKGVLPAPINYGGAHTGRWSGDESINLQNLGAHGHVLDSRVRNMLLPPDECVFIIADQSAVEARVTAWIAGQLDLVRAFEAGRDVYCEFASRVLGRKIRKSHDSDPVAVKATFKRGRAMGKVGVLGGGYGMGPSKCQSYAPGFGIEITFLEAKNIIDTYRESNPKIVRFWHEIERAFRYTTKYGKPCKLDRGLEFSKRGDVTIIRLPSGRELYYKGVFENRRGDMEMPDPQKPAHVIKIYGGYLTENVVQAMCRDSLGDATLAIEEAGYRVALHCHDEVIVVAPKERAEECKSVVLALLRRRPSWAPDCPFDAEATIADRYTK